MLTEHSKKYQWRTCSYVNITCSWSTSPPRHQSSSLHPLRFLFLLVCSRPPRSTNLHDDDNWDRTPSRSVGLVLRTYQQPSHRLHSPTEFYRLRNSQIFCSSLTTPLNFSMFSVSTYVFQLCLLDFLLTRSPNVPQTFGQNLLAKARYSP